MDGNHQTRDGRSGSSPSLRWEDIDRLKWRSVGFSVPDQRIALDSIRIGALIHEGWRFVFDWDGAVIAYLPPLLSERLGALSAVIQRSARKYPMSNRKERDHG